MSEPATVDRLRAGFIDPPADARPMIRWHTMCHEGGWTLWRDEDGEYHADPP